MADLSIVEKETYKSLNMMGNLVDMSAKQEEMQEI